MSIPTNEMTLVASRFQHNRKAAALLREWIHEEDDYDEQVWPTLEETLKSDPITFREPHESGTR